LGDALIPPVVSLPGFEHPLPLDVSSIPSGQFHGAMCGDGLANGRDAGTIGCIVRRTAERTGSLYVLTAGHCLSGSAGSEVDWLEYPYAPNPPNPPLGTVAYRQPLSTSQNGSRDNHFDLGLVAITMGDTSSTIRSLGSINGIRPESPIHGMRVRLVGVGGGRGSALKIGYYDASDFECGFNVDGTEYGFYGLYKCTAFSQRGDSGAAVLDDENRLLGILLGGDSKGTSWSAVMPAQTMLDWYRLSIVSEAEPADDSAVVTRERVPAVNQRDLAINVLGRTIWGEARGEPSVSRMAVANVVVNRVLASPARRFGSTVEAVCQKPAQFSCWNARDPNSAKVVSVTEGNAAFRECLAIARDAIAGRIADNTFGSLHYCTLDAEPRWARGHAPIAVYGRRRFFNNVE
jgi:hypothetical protein